jgi:hypothetical protein
MVEDQVRGCWLVDGKMVVEQVENISWWMEGWLRRRWEGVS